VCVCDVFPELSPSLAGYVKTCYAFLFVEKNSNGDSLSLMIEDLV
jgi:hypothetical protein